MTIEELRANLKEAVAKHDGDDEAQHSETDSILLAYINDEEVNKICSSFSRWCA